MLPEEPIALPAEDEDDEQPAPRASNRPPGGLRLGVRRLRVGFDPHVDVMPELDMITIGDPDEPES